MEDLKKKKRSIKSSKILYQEAKLKQIIKGEILCEQDKDLLDIINEKNTTNMSIPEIGVIEENQSNSNNSSSS